MMLTALTVGQVSGLIAAVVFVLQFVIPNAVSLILAGTLRPSHSAVTWSVVQRNLVSSHWPLLLRSDSVASKGVDGRVRWIVYARPLGLLLVSIAAIVTPLGLHDSIVPSSAAHEVAFASLRDAGSFGASTMPRAPRQFNRECSIGSMFNNMPLACPGTKTQIDFIFDDQGFVKNASLHPGTTYDSFIPQSLIELYESGLETQNKSVASFFDIESRLYTYANYSLKNNGKKYMVDAFRMLQSIILNDNYQPVEGLIVNAKTGGIGFRNHTVPTNIGLGAEWTEDLLFIEPQTECVDLNLTYEMSVSSSGPAFLKDLVLVDNGGFINLNRTYPQIDLSEPNKNIRLRERAYKAAWLTNAWTAMYMNVTRPNPGAWSYLNSSLGRRFPLLTTMAHASVDGISSSGVFSTFVSPQPLPSNTSTYNYSSLFNTSSSANQQLYPNPFKITYNNYTTNSLLCKGAGGRDLANASNVNVECGLVFGVARPIEGPDTLVPAPYTRWRQSVYSCASANKASIKRVKLRYNATLGTDLSALSVISIEDKNYTSETMPRWGVEDVDFYLTQISQLWGLISESKANAPNMTSFRAPYMWLPGYMGLASSSINGWEYMPGHTGPSAALAAIYSSSTGSAYDWSGKQSVAMFARWKQLTSDTAGAAKLANLIWTDLAANYMTTSKSWNSKAVVSLQKRESTNVNQGSQGDPVTIPITTFSRRVRYTWIYAVPALVALTFAVLILVSALVLSLVEHTGSTNLRHYLDRLSPGRLLAAQQIPHSDQLAPTKQWIERSGKEQISLNAEHAAIQGSHPEKQDAQTSYSPSYHSHVDQSEEVDNSKYESPTAWKLPPVHVSEISSTRDEIRTEPKRQWNGYERVNNVDS